MKYEFLPQSVPSFSAVEVLGALLTKYPDFLYKEATLNPTNPRDRAVGWEVDIVNQFRAGGDLNEVIGQRATPSGRPLFLARALEIATRPVRSATAASRRRPREWSTSTARPTASAGT